MIRTGDYYFSIPGYFSNLLIASRTNLYAINITTGRLRNQMICVVMLWYLSAD